MKMPAVMMGLMLSLNALTGLEASSPKGEIKQINQATPIPPPPIPPLLRNVSFISRWIIYGTYFSDYIFFNKCPSALDAAWNLEIEAIVGSSDFVRFIDAAGLNTLNQLLLEYKELGKEYIKKILRFKNPGNLLDQWNDKGQQIALFFQSYQFDPNDELPNWFAKATADVAAQANQYVTRDLTDFFASYGSAVRNFQEIGFTLSPTPCD